MITALMLIGAVDAMSRSPSPEEVTGNPDCKIQTAHELALLYWPSTNATRFAVLNDIGTLFDGEVPFVVDLRTRISLIKREDGKVLVAFAKFGRHASNAYGAFTAAVPVRVYLDGKTIYQTDGVGQFDVAPDGSSFFIIDSPEDALSLQIHEIDSGEMRHIDLMEVFASHGIWQPKATLYLHIDHAAQYSRDPDEVMVMPSPGADLEGDYVYGPNAGGGASYLFYSLERGDWRLLPGEGGAAYFRSSREAYFASQCKGSGASWGFDIPGSETVITKKQYLWGDRDEPEAIEAWSRSIDLDGFGGKGVVFLDNDSLLALHAANTHVLDATTGETVFAFPTTENLSRAAGLVADIWPSYRMDQETGGYVFNEMVKKNVPVGRAYHDRALARLKNVMPLDATVDDVNVVSNFRVEHGEFVLSQHLHRREPPDDRVFDYVFDMNGLHVEAKPISRRENRSRQIKTCGIDVDSRAGLQVSGGRLVYRSARGPAHAD